MDLLNRLFRMFYGSCFLRLNLKMLDVLGRSNTFRRQYLIMRPVISLLDKVQKKYSFNKSSYEAHSFRRKRSLGTTQSTISPRWTLAARINLRKIGRMMGTSCRWTDSRTDREGLMTMVMTGFY